jgi:hypothetical protein
MLEVPNLPRSVEKNHPKNNYLVGCTSSSNQYNDSVAWHAGQILGSKYIQNNKK